MTTTGRRHYRDLPVDDAFEYGRRHPVSEFFGSTGALVSIVTFAPDEAGPLQRHHPPVEEYYLVLDGTLCIRLGDDRFAADRGTVVFIPSGTVHQPTNESTAPATLCSFVTPDVPLDEYTEYLDA